MAANETARTTVLIDNEEAKAALAELQTELRKIKDLRKEALEKGDVAAFEMYDKEFKKVGREASKMAKEVDVVENSLKDLNGLSLTQLRGSLTQAQKVLNNMAKTDPNWAAQKKKVQELSAAYSDMKAEMASTGGLFGKLQASLTTMPGSFGAVTSGIMATGKAALAFLLTPVGAILGIIGAVAMGAKALIKNSMEFGKAASSLSAITGATGKDLDFLKQKAREISKESTQSATDMLKAFEKIGSDLPQLLANGPLLAEVTKNAVALSEATGGELSITDAAKAAAGAMNQFNIPMEQSARAVNALAAGALVGSAGITEINESMKNSGAVMDGANMTLEQSIAMYEVLATKQLKGAEAGTAARGVIMKLQAAGVGYASGQFNMRDALVEANAKIDAQSTALEKDALAQKLFGLEGITAGKILLDNVDMYDSLTKAVTGTNAAYDQQKIQNDNLTTSNKKFGEAWTNLMLAVEDGNGFLAQTWKDLVDGGTKMLNFFSKAIDLFKSKEAKQRTEDVKAQKAAEEAKRAQLMQTAADLKLTVDEKISLAELETLVAEAQAEEAKKLETQKTEETKKQIKEREAAAKEARDKSFEELETANNRELLALKRKNFDENKTDEESKMILEQKELEFLARKLALQQKYGEDTTDTEAAIFDKQLSIADAYAKKREESQKALAEAEKEYQKEIDKFMNEETVDDGSDAKIKKIIDDNKQVQDIKFDLLSEEQKRKIALGDELAKIDKLQKAGAIATTEEAEAMKDAIVKKHAGQRFDTEMKYAQAAQDVLSGISNFFGAMKERELAKAGDDAVKKEQIEKKYAKKQQTVAAAQAAIAGAVAIMQLWASPSILPEPAGSIYKGVMSAIIAGTTIAQIGAIKSQQFATGGFTTPGAKYQPAGIVHAGEFVASQESVNNPTLRPLFNLIDIAQKNGNAGMLNFPAAINAVYSIPNRGYANGGFGTPTATPAPAFNMQPKTDPALLQLMDMQTQFLGKLATEGVHATANVNANAVFAEKEKYDQSVSASEY